MSNLILNPQKEKEFSSFQEVKYTLKGEGEESTSRNAYSGEIVH